MDDNKINDLAEQFQKDSYAAARECDVDVGLVTLFHEFQFSFLFRKLAELQLSIDELKREEFNKL